MTDNQPVKKVKLGTIFKSTDISPGNKNEIEFKRKNGLANILRRVQKTDHQEVKTDKDKSVVTVETRLKSQEDNKNDSDKDSDQTFIIVSPREFENFKISWSAKMTYELIEEYKSMMDKFRDPFIRQKDLWILVAEKLCSKGFDVTWEACDQKWRNLKHSFNITYQKEMCSTPMKRRWEYYEALKSVFLPQMSSDKGKFTGTTIKIDSAENIIVEEKEKPHYFRYTHILNDEVQHETEIEEEEEIVIEEEEQQEGAQTIEDHVEYVTSEISWFQEFMNQYQANENRRLALMEKMHSERMKIEERKCKALEMILSKIS